jgi:radical SAM protein with 4Fe4S-binding SPASM domain
VEFPLPIRVRWDIERGGRIGPAGRIAARILEAEPLFVELNVDGKPGLSALSRILDDFAKSFSRVALTLPILPGAADTVAGRDGVDVAWRIAPEEPGPFPAEASELSFVPDGRTIGRLPDVIAAFARSGASTLHLPNINAIRFLAETGIVPVPSPVQVADALGRIGDRPVSLDRRRLVVHDYFLWDGLRKLYPGSAGERLEFAGCQAGTALAYVDADGDVYPCDALPIRLGNLAGDDSFERVWEAPARVALVAAIRATPAGCAACPALEACRSGCRGLGYAADGTFDTPDPECPVPR